MLLLAIETSSARGSLALLEGRSLIQEALFPEGLVHGREITVHLKAMMARAGLAPGDLKAILVGLGPGSYTGIRVGVTAAKTLAFALRIPVLGESSLRVLAAGAPAERGGGASGAGSIQVVTAVDAKQRHLYLARFRVAALPEGGVEAERELEDRVLRLPPAPLPPEALAEIGGVAAPGATVVGDAADQVLAAAGVAPGLLRAPRERDWPRAAVLGELLAREVVPPLPCFDPEAVHRLVPIYLRASEAERKLGAAR